ncbi:putative acetyltransferase [Amorphus suaedae]
MSTTEICFRPATDSDGPAMAHVIATIFSDYPNCHFVPDEFPELDAPASHYAARDGRLWIAASGDRIVGSLAVARTPDPKVFELFKVYLLPEARGGGRAGTMLSEAVAFARAGGGTRLRLWTDTRFAEGHRFYERNGFVRLPGSRAVPDASDTWEFAYTRDIDDRAPAP